LAVPGLEAKKKGSCSAFPVADLAAEEPTLAGCLLAEAARSRSEYHDNTLLGSLQELRNEIAQGVGMKKSEKGRA
jgi:hypothetical protein